MNTRSRRNTDDAQGKIRDCTTLTDRASTMPSNIYAVANNSARGYKKVRRSTGHICYSIQRGCIIYQEETPIVVLYSYINTAMYLQPMIPPKRFGIFPPDWGIILRRSRRVLIFLLKHR